MHFLITAVTCLCMCAILLFKKKCSYLIGSFCGFFAGIAVWQVSVFVRQQRTLEGSSFPVDLATVGLILTFLFSLNILILLLQGITIQWHPLKWHVLCILPAILLLILLPDILSLKGEKNSGILSAQQIIYLSTLLYYVYTLCLLVIVNYRLNRNPSPQSSFFLEMIGLLFFAPALRVFDRASSPFSINSSLVSPGFSSSSAYVLVFFCGIFVYDVLRYGDSGIRTALGSQFGYLYTATLFNGIYLLFSLGLVVVFGRLFGFPLISFWSVITFFIIVFITNPLRSIQRWLQRLFHRSQYNRERLLFEIGQQVVSIFDLETLSNFLVKRMKDVLSLKRCCLVLVLDTLEWQVIADTGNRERVPNLYRDQKLMKYLRQKQYVQLRSVVGKEETERLERSAATVLLDSGFCVSVPLVSEEKVIGCILLSEKLSSEHFFREELAMLSTVATQVATAITNTRLHKELLHAERLATIGRFSAEIAHEVRNPLLSIKGAAQVISKKLSSEHIGQEFATMIIEESNRLNRVVTEFLNYSRLPEPIKQPCDVRECIEIALSTLKTESFASFKDRFQPKPILVEKRYMDDIPLVNLDMELMEQVFLNLFKNAFDAMPEDGKLIITVRKANRFSSKRSVPLKRDSTESGHLEIVIKDTGCGIASQHLPHLFEPFFTTKEGGTGLGLSIVRNIIQAHGGKIQLESFEGEGTTVRILLAYSEKMEKKESIYNAKGGIVDES